MYVGSKVAACNKGKGAKHSRRSFFDLFVSSFKAKISPNDGYIDKKKKNKMCTADLLEEMA